MKFRSPNQKSRSLVYWKSALTGRVPESSLSGVAHLMSYAKLEFIVSRPRNSKFGDYRQAHGESLHRITVNSDLGPERFLLTLVHEIAHLYTFVAFGNTVKPHGPEWKRLFAKCMDYFLNENVFSRAVLPHLEAHLNSPKATSCTDLELHKAFDELEGISSLALVEIESGTTFRMNSGRIFIKGEKQRTRFLCREVPSNKQYLIHGSTPVDLEEAPSETLSLSTAI